MSHKFFLGGDKGYVYTVPPAGWGIVLTKSAKELAVGSAQTGTGRVDCQPVLGYQRVMDTDFAKPRAVVERTIQKIKRFRRLDSGRVFFKSNIYLLQDLVVIACVYVNKYVRNELENDDNSMDDGHDDSDDEGITTSSEDEANNN